MDSDTRCALYAERIMRNIGAQVSHRMLDAGFAPECIFAEARDACTLAAYILDRLTRAEYEAEAAARGEGDETEARLLLNAAEHFRRLLRLRIPATMDLRILPGDVPEGLEIISRGEPTDYRP